MEGQKQTYPASNQQANRVRRSAELSGLIFCISNEKAAVSPSAGVTGYQSWARPRPPGGRHSLLCAHQRSPSPLTHSMMGFKIRKKKRKKQFPLRAAKLWRPVSANTSTCFCGFSGKMNSALIKSTWLRRTTRPHAARQLSPLFFSLSLSPALVARRQQLNAAATAGLNSGRWKVFSAVLRTRFVNSQSQLLWRRNCKIQGPRNEMRPTTQWQRV